MSKYLMLGLSLFVLFGYFSGASEQTPCKVVSEVGGCDSDSCAVRFTDGSTSPYAHHPIVGMTMCKGGRFSSYSDSYFPE